MSNLNLWYILYVIYSSIEPLNKLESRIVFEELLTQSPENTHTTIHILQLSTDKL